VSGEPTVDSAFLDAVPMRTTALTHSLDDEVVVYHAETRTVTELNQLGGAIWHLIDGRRSVDAICELVREHVAVPRDVLERDIAAFLERMRAEDLICYRR